MCKLVLVRQYITIIQMTSNYLIEEGGTKAVLFGLVEHGYRQLIVHRFEFFMQLKVILKCDLLSGLYYRSEGLVRVVLEMVAELNGEFKLPIIAETL